MFIATIFLSRVSKSRTDNIVDKCWFCLLPFGVQIFMYALKSMAQFEIPRVSHLVFSSGDDISCCKFDIRFGTDTISNLHPEASGNF